MQYKYSFIIPCYTAIESDFRRCLDYIKNQTMQPYEVICIDDASPVETPKIALEYGFKYIRHEVNKHNGGARNTGIREATGDYLIFCNSDDYFELDTVEQIDKVNNGEDLIIVGFSVFGTVIKKDRFIPDKSNTPNISKLNWNGEAMHIVKRQFILDNNLFELENVPIADKDWAERVEKLQQSYTFVPKALYNYQWGHDGAIMTQITKKQIVSNLENPDYYNKIISQDDKNIDIIIYEHLIPDIGGNATSLVNWVKHMSKYYNITVLYKDIAVRHRRILSRHARCVLYNGQQLECDKLIWNSSWGDYPTTIKYKGKPFQLLHANYKEVYKLNGFKYPIPKVPTEHIAVSKHVSEVFEEMYSIPSKVIYNMLDPDVKVEKVLRLITCSRLTKEKGLDNILKFAQMLKKFNKKFIWFIYGSGNIPTDFKEYPEIILMGVSYDLPSYIADCDYLVHMSYTEGDPYCTKEALQVNTPCITTSYPATYEQIIDGVNGYILNFELFTKGTDEEWKEVIEKIYNKIPVFKYENKDEEYEKMWIKELGEPKGIKKDIMKGNKNMKYRVKATRDFTDVLTGIKRKPNAIYELSGDNTWIVDEERYFYLLDNNAIELVETIEEPIVVEETKAEDKPKEKKTTKKVK